ncbi:MAG: CHAD domain-containing protein [Gammaproteobacteria bacterium]|nr:CHAD domain-containing protein [Gammaproteobacteria bacterium]
MNEQINTGFLLPHDFGVARLIQRLGGEARCRVGTADAFAAHFYDSFDWRLHAAGLRLMQLETPQGTLLKLKSGDGAESAEPVVGEARPQWPADLPNGELKDAVVNALAMRVLLPVVSVRGEVTEVALLNEDAKTVVRLQHLALRCESADVDEPRKLLPRVRLLEVRGYADELADVAAFMQDKMEWPRAPACLFDEALAAIGREAGDYSSKLDVPLKPGLPALNALRRVLLTLLDTIERNLAGTRADLDSEFLHDLRVATRRTRSAIAQVKRVLPDEVVADFRQRFAWLGQITGPTRDLDVFLLELPHYRASLPAPMGGHLDALEEHLRAAHKQEQNKLARQLGSAEMKALLADWRHVLEAESPPGETAWFADLPIERVAAQRIWRMYRKVRKDGRLALQGGPPEVLHALRKDCKKLRYLIEFFRRAFPEDDLKDVVRNLKRLLDNLGTFQDRQVQAEKLAAFAEGFDRDDPRCMSTVLAIGGLVADLLRDQQRAHERFADCFAAFDSEANRADYKRVFKQRAEGLG